MQHCTRLLVTRGTNCFSPAVFRRLEKSAGAFRLHTHQSGLLLPFGLNRRQLCTDGNCIERNSSAPSARLALKKSNLGAVNPIALRDGRYSGRPWSEAEDNRLREAVEKYGRDWAKAADHVGSGRTNKGCRQRWLLRLQDSVNKERFTSSETKRILQLSEQYPKQWTKITEELGSGHIPDQVRDFVVNRRSSSDTYNIWTGFEDILLRHAVQVHGVGKWSAVAEMVPGRNDASCYSRWTFALNPDLVWGQWSPEEDARLLAAVEALQKSGEPFHFGDVAVLMDNRRHRKACRARYKRLVHKKQVEDPAKSESVATNK